VSEVALYRKYRSQSFDTVIGQPQVVGTLKNAIASNRLSHAYLFTGPRGVGKTSVARLLARAANCTAENPGDRPCGTCSNCKVEIGSHLDLIEIDAASNRGIDDARALREKITSAPSMGRYKVYIIDEVHMLTREAFNALLKTLEEPPAHCIFILATTESHKLPETIISRTQRFEFKPINPGQAAKHLQNIAKKEKIDISPEALELLAEFSNGSFRDSIGYLDQLSASNKVITEADVRRILGTPSQTEVLSLIEALKDGDPKALASAVEHIKEQGISAAELATAVSKQLRQQIIDGQGRPALTRLLKELVDVKGNSRPYDYLEIILLEAAIDPVPAAASQATERPPKPPAPSSGGPAKPIDKLSDAKPKANVERPGSFNLDMWNEVVDQAKSQAASVYTALRIAQPSFSDETLTLTFQFPLHKKKLEQSKNKALIADLIEELSGTKLKIECVVDKSIGPIRVPEAEPQTVESPAADIHSITNIFGAAEMVES
jgi:DNA polymerase III subunit gamma/tau